MDPRTTESYGEVPKVLTNHEWTEELTFLLLHHGKTQTPTGALLPD